MYIAEGPESRGIKITECSEPVEGTCSKTVEGNISIQEAEANALSRRALVHVESKILLHKVRGEPLKSNSDLAQSSITLLNNLNCHDGLTAPPKLS